MAQSKTFKCHQLILFIIYVYHKEKDHNTLTHLIPLSLNRAAEKTQFGGLCSPNTPPLLCPKHNRDTLPLSMIEQKEGVGLSCRDMLCIGIVSKACKFNSPLTVRCTQLPLWKVSYCCSSISTLHSYQPWSSERTFSIRREDLPCRLARPGRQRQRWGLRGHREVRRTGGLNLMKEVKGAERVRGEWKKERKEEKGQMNI